MQGFNSGYHSGRTMISLLLSLNHVVSAPSMMLVCSKDMETSPMDCLLSSDSRMGFMASSHVWLCSSVSALLSPYSLAYSSISRRPSHFAMHSPPLTSGKAHTCCDVLVTSLLDSYVCIHSWQKTSVVWKCEDSKADITLDKSLFLCSQGSTMHQAWTSACSKDLEQTSPMNGLLSINSCTKPYCNDQYQHLKAAFSLHFEIFHIWTH